jgi:hypothetical protein
MLFDEPRQSFDENFFSEQYGQGHNALPYRHIPLFFSALSQSHLLGTIRPAELTNMQ